MKIDHSPEKRWFDRQALIWDKIQAYITLEATVANIPDFQEWLEVQEFTYAEIHGAFQHLHATLSAYRNAPISRRVELHNHNFDYSLLEIPPRFSPWEKFRSQWLESFGPLWLVTTAAGMVLGALIMALIK